MRILYVEDNPANLSLMQRIARMGGHEIISYTEGEVALSNYERDNPDLILLDVQLAGALTGVDVVKALRERGVTKPVVAVTAYAMLGDRERFLEAGFDNYLSKPLPVAELVEMVQQYELKLKAAPVPVPAAPPVTAPAPAVTAPASAPASAPPSTPAVPSAPVSGSGLNEATQPDRQKVLGGVDLAALSAKKPE